MTKKDIVRTISEEVGLTQQQTKEIVQKTFDAIIESLVREQRIELRNFGVFEVKPRAARKARNPRTGEQVDVPRKHVVTFKPGKSMEAKVRELDAAEARRVADSSTPPADINPTQPKNSSDDSGRSSGPASPPDGPSGRWDND
ncbi:DNA-binding protein HU [Rubripirellula lacrimiformis]|uniref:DNA-binding protein HU n=1 Tax=Rubripirellula lacrimiformis TaxID=1930273 RepID=A0A517NFY3_9BACT|nr:HU family DNA-binding protein [Rubripirellula lacrimiformis]QDT06049.1 DNA-binding protein HU [Rubripirellula lacrimiformis]